MDIFGWFTSTTEETLTSGEQTSDQVPSTSEGNSSSGDAGKTLDSTSNLNDSSGSQAGTTEPEIITEELRPIIKKTSQGIKLAEFTVDATGKKHGTYKDYYPSGIIKLETTYSRDKDVGPRIIYDPKGVERSRIIYEQSKESSWYDAWFKPYFG